MGIDLAIVRDEAVGMREPPGRKRVGREALMHQRNRRLGQRILKIEIEAADVGRQEQTLVHDGARREGRNVEFRDAGKLVLLGERRQRVLRLLANGKQLALERILVLYLRAMRDDRLADQRHLFEHGLAETGRIGRHVAPTDQDLALVLDEAFELLDRDVASLGLGRQETHRDGVMARLRQGHAGALRPIAQKRVRNLDQTAGPIPDERVGADRATMVKIDKYLKSQGNYTVRLLALDVGNKADAARVMLVAGVIKTLFRR